MTATNNNDNSNKKDKATPAASKQQKPAKKSSNTTVDDDQQSQKKKIRPTDSIFNRIKWDISIPKDQVLIGYLDRFIGVIEVPFSKWKGVDEHEGVPLHRIRYYKLNGTIIWDREKKIDMLTGGDVSHLANRNIASSSSTPSASASPSTRNGGSSSRSSQRTHYPFKQQIPYYSYNPESEEWEVIRTTSHTRSVKMSNLRVLTYNVLFDMHDADKIYTPKRVPHILNIIQDSDADIIALQEVRRSFLEELCREDWVRRNYFISDVSGDDTVQDSYGQVMLSKFEPNALYLHRFSSMKFALLPVFIILPDDSFVKEKLIIPIVHLSSDHVTHSTSKRAKQLVQLFQEVKLLEADHAIIMGDFNFSDGEAEDELLYNWGKDAWLSTHKIHKRPGYTFDPSANICAAITTKKNISRRLDKVVFASQKLVPQHTELQGLDTISFLDEMTQKQVNLHPSDHYALQCDFIITNSQSDSVIDKLTRVHSSSLVVVPPRASWKRIQKIRNTFDPSAKRWPPHINLIYPFFEKNDLDLVKPLIENKVTSIEPFIIKLNSFEYDENGVVYLRPSTNNFELVKLQESLQKLFPTCHNMSMIDSNYVPRLEVATFSVEDVQSKVAELQSSWEPVEFLVDQIFVIDRDDTTFNVEYSAPLGMNPTLKIEDVSTDLNDFYVQHNLVENRDSIQQKRQALDYLESTILTHFSTSDSSSTLSQREYLLKTFGSYRLGIKSNDIDAVCICTSQNPAHSGEEFLESMKYIMCDDAERIASCRTILDAMVPMLNIKFVDGIEIDLLYIHIPVTLEDSDEAVGKLSRAQVKIISGLKECGCMLRYVPDRKLFQALISFVKFWAKQRGIYSNAYGYLGGISYAILCAYVCREFKSSTKETSSLFDLIKLFFSTFAKWKWPQSVSITNHSSKDQSKQKPYLPIMLPAYPYGNSTRNVSLSTQKIIMAELKRANEILESCDDSNMISSLLNKVVESSEPEFHLAYKKYICFDVSSQDHLTFSKWFGWIRSRLIHLIVTFDRRKILTHVFPNIEESCDQDGNVHATIRIGIVSDLSSNKILEEEINAFENLVNSWEKRPEEPTTLTFEIKENL